MTPALEREIELRDGTRALIRAVRKDDRIEVEHLFEWLSADSLYLRFHEHLDRVPGAEISDALTIESNDSSTLAVIHDDHVIGIGRWKRVPGRPGRAGLAFIVEDAHQGMGVVSQMLDILAESARERGIVEFEADVLSENHPMLDVFQKSGYPLRSRLKYGDVHITFPIA
ncbi:MAG: GNAT family N-acetyltransferase [Dehalococcoidia bacterium]